MYHYYLPLDYTITNSNRRLIVVYDFSVITLCNDVEIEKARAIEEDVVGEMN